ncbi:MAG: hypothetical protein ACFUZC_22345 [Chthoniobacteraceae bacterium]
MKLNRILTTGALALSVAATANAATYTLHIAGSSAYRAAVHQGVLEILGSSAQAAYADGSKLSGANAAIFTGTTATAHGSLPAGTVLTVCTSWTGSVAGIYSVVSGTSTSRGFLPTSTTTSTSGTSDNADIGKSLITDKTSVVDIALSDVNASTAQSVIGTLDTSVLSEASTGAVGICPFKWLISGTTSGVSNITAQNVRALYNSSFGTIDKSFLTSGTGTGTVYAFGRDADSGTRLTAFAETGLGASYRALQYGLLTSGSLSTTGTIGLTPAATVNTVHYNEGYNGYASGGDLVKALAFTGTATSSTALAYVSVSDAASALTSGSATAQELTYNGVPYSVDNVKKGAYTFWSYEHLFYRSNAATTGAGLFGEALASQLVNTTVPNLSSTYAYYIPVSAMNVQRTSEEDGGTVLPND